MRVGDLFAGIGGASLAVHAVIPDAETMWQSDLVNEAVRRRHFPDAAQLVGDVRALDPVRLPRVDLLTAGFPCTDLSVAGKQAGLDGPASGLYREVLRFCGANAADLYDLDKVRVVFGGGYQPERVLIENVPALLGYLPRLCSDFRALGYGLTWTVCEAADAGHPHLRRRVFVLAALARLRLGTRTHHPRRPALARSPPSPCCPWQRVVSSARGARSPGAACPGANRSLWWRVMTPAERVSAHNAAELLRNPRDRAKWLSSLGDDRPDFIAALRGNAPAWFPVLDREKYALVGRLLGPKILAAL